MPITVGGDLYIGIDDAGVPVGVVNPDEIIQALTSVIQDSIFPSLVNAVSTEILTIGENLQIVRIHVSPAIPSVFSGPQTLRNCLYPR